jgi:hypothetical protein
MPSFEVGLLTSNKVFYPCMVQTMQQYRFILNQPARDPEFWARQIIVKHLTILYVTP